MKVIKLKNIVKKIIFRRTSFEKASGLMFKPKRVIKNNAMVFVFDHELKIPIHMVFVFYRIDVLWLDKKKKVIDLKEKIAPFRPHISHKGKAQFLVELSSGDIEKNKLKIGDRIEF